MYLFVPLAEEVKSVSLVWDAIRRGFGEFASCLYCLLVEPRIWTMVWILTVYFPEGCRVCYAPGHTLSHELTSTQGYTNKTFGPVRTTGPYFR